MSRKNYKVWGVKDRKYENDKCEVDLLYLLKDSFCSEHCHKKKINKFHVLSGRVAIETDYGTLVLGRGEESPEIEPNTMHRFKALTNAIMLEIAYVKRGKIDKKDIKRKIQGGRVVNGKEVTLKELKQRGKLDYKVEVGKIKEQIAW